MSEASAVRRWLAVASILLIVSAVLVSLWFVARASDQPKATNQRLVEKVGASSVAQATSSATPSLSALPPGASITSATKTAAFIDPTGLTHNAQDLTEISLAGQANQSAPATAAVPLSSTGAIHPATVITSNYLPGQDQLPPADADANLFNIEAVNVAGNPGRLTTSADGVGVVKVEWLDADGYHEILEDRLATSDGLSGVPSSTIVQLAQSLYGN